MSVETTRTLCPVCLKTVEGQVVEAEGRVYMRRVCPEHGRFEGLISGDAAIYREADEYNRPGKKFKKYYTEPKLGCPNDCGPCTDHQQHTCLALMEITNACNMKCPTCFSSSPTGAFKDMETIDRMLGTFVEYEHAPECLMISGGEPTIHPKIEEVIVRAKSKGVKWVVVNSNGKRIAQDDRFAEFLGREKVWLYLQFDGFKPSTSLKIRGEEDLLETKMACIEKAGRYGIGTIAVMTVEQGINDDEIFAVADLMLKTPQIRGVVYQPVFHAGRHDNSFDPMNRITLADVLHKLADQSNGFFRIKDFIPDPCPYPTCGSTTYLYVKDGKTLVLPREVDVKKYLGLIESRSFPDAGEMITTALEKLFSASALPGNPNVAQSFCDSCGLSMVEVADVTKHLKMIKVKPFMDAWTFDLKRLMKCCVSEITTAGTMVPFCAYNNIPQYRSMR